MEDQISHTHKLSSRVAGLESDVGNIKVAVADISTSVNGLIQNLRQETKTNWSVLAAFGSVIMGFLSMLGYLALTPVTNSIDKITTKVDRHLSSSGHDMVLERTSALRRDFDGSKYALTDQDRRLQGEIKTGLTVIQKEFNLRTDTLQKQFENQIGALDTTLQREMRLLLKATEVERSNQGHLMNRVVNWQDNHDKRVVGLNAAQWERIKALERTVYDRPLSVTHGKPPGSE